MLTKKNFVITFFIILSIPVKVLYAQDDTFEGYSFDDEFDKKPPYFALAFGINANFNIINFDAFNNRVPYGASNDILFDGPLVGMEINFFSAIAPIINNARIGLSYQSGKK